MSGAAPDNVFAAVTDVEAFPAFCSDVREVRVDVADGVRRSAWKVHFRGGTLEWLEQDELDLIARTMTFRRIEGDFKEFHGSWRVQDRGPDCAVDFDVTFDLGIPALRTVLEPLAAKNLRVILSAVLRGLFGSTLQLEGGQ